MKKFKVKEALTIGLPIASLSVSSANLATNAKRRKENLVYQEKQIEALGKLTTSLEKVDRSLKAIDKLPAAEKEKKKKGLIRFFQKSNSHTADLAIKGGLLGGTVSGLGSILPKFIGKKTGEVEVPHIETDKNNKRDRGHLEYHKAIGLVDDPNYKHPKIRKYYNRFEENPELRRLLISLGGAAIGATLGALAGAIWDISEAINRKTTVNARLMKGVLENLKKSGKVEGKDFTRDPKMATLMKTKVCLVISKSADSLRLLINMVNDPKLKSLSEGIVKNLPSMSTVTEKASDRFNDLNITTLTTNKGDATWVASIAERFISAGYPVYLVEVG